MATVLMVWLSATAPKSVMLKMVAERKNAGTTGTPAPKTRSKARAIKKKDFMCCAPNASKLVQCL
jgi:hypothetical protein